MDIPIPYRLRLYCRLCRVASCFAVLISLGGLGLCNQARNTYKPVFIAESSPLQKIVPPALSSKDEAVYRAIFSAQKKSDWQTADAAIANLDNNLLLGHVLADRYLHRNYDVKSEELVDWLNHYSDHPQASAIYALAVQKIPSLKNAMPALSKQVTLGGYGDDNGLAAAGDSAFARAWRAGLQEWRAGNKTAAAKLFSGITHRNDLSSWRLSAAAYWSYRAYEALGNQAEADKYLHMAARESRSFYGIIARKQLYEKLYLDTSPLTLTPDDRLQMVGDQAIRRTMILAQIGMNELAEQELRTLFPQCDEAGKIRLLSLAHELNLASVQISMAKQLSADGTLDYAKYPTPAWQPEGGFKIEPELIFALMRQESGFHASAVSPMGALGLMQLMPKTASLMQKRLHNNAAGSVTEPVWNMTLGQDYIRQLLNNELVEGNLFYMLAAYNAGPGRLQEWKHTLTYHNDPLLFVESIPIPQTRHYVMQVMTNYWIYSELAGKPSHSSYALAQNRWPIYEETTSLASLQ